MKPVVLVGMRRDEDDAWRLRLWDHAVVRIVGQLGHVCDGDVPYFVGEDDPGGPFSLAQASNHAFEQACASRDWDVALYMGADWIAGSADTVRAALDLALRERMLVFPHNLTLVFHEQATRAIVDRTAEPESMLTYGADVHRNTFGGMLAVPRVLWEDVGGFDERFSGWGGEDISFWAACCAVRGHFERVPGWIGHLWHERPRALREDAPGYPANDELMRRYIAAKDDPEGMRAILRERGVETPTGR